MTTTDADFFNRPDTAVYGCCPACGKESILVRRFDRYFHEDGSNNRDCWRALLRGERPFDTDDLATIGRID